MEGAVVGLIIVLILVVIGLFSFEWKAYIRGDNKLAAGSSFDVVLGPDGESLIVMKEGVIVGAKVGSQYYPKGSREFTTIQLSREGLKPNPRIMPGGRMHDGLNPGSVPLLWDTNSGNIGIGTGSGSTIMGYEEAKLVGKLPRL